MVNKYESKFTNLQRSILNFLYFNPTKSFNMIRLSKYLEVSQPAIKKALPFLEKNELISISQDKDSKRYSIKLNKDNPKITHLKRAQNVKNLYESEVFSFLFSSFPGCTLILFGSYSFGEDTESSDIDIAIIGCKEKQVNVSKFEDFLERKISLHFYESFKKIKDYPLSNNLLNGIVFSGGISI